MLPERYDYAACVRDWDRTPYVEGVVKLAFAEIAQRKKGVPHTSPLLAVDHDSFGGDAAVFGVWGDYCSHSGTFNDHFGASIPFVVEQEARLISAMELFAVQKYLETQEPIVIHTVGTAEAIIARTLAARNSYIHTLSDSTTIQNKMDFDRNRTDRSHFHHGPFYSVTQTEMNAIGGVLAKPPLIIYEDTAFQMMAENRSEQIGFVLDKRGLHPDGLLILTEKCLAPTNQGYEYWEQKKDDDWKSRFFTKDQIEQKKGAILKTMQKGQVALPALVDSIRETLPHVAVVWSSGNFYTLLASKNSASVQKFCSGLIPPCIPKDFVDSEYHALPLKSAGLDGINLAFREPSREALDAKLHSAHLLSKVA